MLFEEPKNLGARSKSKNPEKLAYEPGQKKDFRMSHRVSSPGNPSIDRAKHPDRQAKGLQMMKLVEIPKMIKIHKPNTAFLTGLRSSHCVLSMIFGFLVKF